MDEFWWINRHKLNMRDLLLIVRLYLEGDYPENLFKARILDYESEYSESKP